MSRTVLEMFIKKEQKANKIFKMHKTAYLLFCLGTAENRRLIVILVEISVAFQTKLSKVSRILASLQLKRQDDECVDHLLSLK